jgi:hypothetical protein
MAMDASNWLIPLHAQDKGIIIGPMTNTLISTPSTAFPGFQV